MGGGEGGDVGYWSNKQGGELCFIGEVKDCIRAIIVESALGNEVEQRDK